MSFQHTPAPGSRSYELWKRRCKEDKINFWAFFISIFLVLASGIVALTFLWLPKRHLTQGYTAQSLPDLLYAWNNTFYDGRSDEPRTATCTADYWAQSSYVYYDCTSSGSLDSLAFSLQSLTPFTSQRYRTRSVSPRVIRYYTSRGYASAAAASRAATATGTITSSSTFTLQSGFAQATSAVRNLAAQHAEPTPAPQTVYKRQSSSSTTFYDHPGELSAGAVVSTFPTPAPEPTSIPIQTPKISNGFAIFFSIVIILGMALSAATLWMVSYNLKVARSKVEPPPGINDSPNLSLPDLGTRSTAAPLRPPQGDTDSIHGEPAPPYSEQPSDVEAQPSPPPKEEEDNEAHTEAVQTTRLPKRMGILDAYNLLPSYAVFGWWQMLSILAFTLEIVVWALLASFVSHLVTFIKDGGCIAPDTNEYDLTYSVCRRFWGVRPIIWSSLPGAMPVTVMQYGYPVVIVLIMMLVFFLAHLALFIALCRKSVLCQRHDTEPLGHNSSGRYVGFTRAGYFCFLDTPGVHHPHT